jgi:spore coat polysaccharide biosynthesis predicted glycosyltransferase SpsG
VSGFDILVLADGGSIGYGHLNRTVTIARALRLIGRAPLFQSANAESMDFVAAAGFPCHRVGSLLDFDRDGPAAAKLILVDSYDVSMAWLERRRAQGYRIAMVEDGCRLARYAAEIVIDACPGSDRLPYVGDGATRFLLGPAYFPLRDTLLTPPSAVARQDVLVTFGGSDPDDVSARIVGAVREAADRPPCRVLLGPGYRGTIKPGRSAGLEIVSDPRDIGACFASAVVAISGAGQTALELAYFGVPSVLMRLSDDQRFMAEGLARAGASIDCGPHREALGSNVVSLALSLWHNARRRSEMSNAGRRLIDGHGAGRIADEINNAWFRP